MSCKHVKWKFERTKHIFSCHASRHAHTRITAIDAELIPYLYLFLKLVLDLLEFAGQSQPSQASPSGPMVSLPEVKCGSKTLEICTRPAEAAEEQLERVRFPFHRSFFQPMRPAEAARAG